MKISGGCEEQRNSFMSVFLKECISETTKHCFSEIKLMKLFVSFETFLKMIE